MDARYHPPIERLDRGRVYPWNWPLALDKIRSFLVALLIDLTRELYRRWTLLDRGIGLYSPFFIFAAALKKIKEDKAIGICILSHWPAQAWLPMMKNIGRPEKRYISTKPIAATSTNPSRPDPPTTQAPLSPRRVCLLSFRFIGLSPFVTNRHNSEI